MRMSRRNFLKAVLATGAGLMLPYACSNTGDSACESSGSTLISTSTAGKPYAVVDTGQTAFYDNLSTLCDALTSPGQAFYGQDAQYAGNLPSYTPSGDNKTVYDNVTGLTWMKGPNMTLETPAASDKKTYAQALTYVDAVNAAAYGGYGDWRLPSVKELYSLIMFTGTDPSGLVGSDTSGLKPFIDNSIFNFAYGQTSAGERIIDSQYLSSNVFIYYTDDSNKKYFGVNFADGRIKGYDAKMMGGAEKTFYVQLVRGNTGYGVNEFLDNGDGTVTDKATGLMWSKQDSGTGMNWKAALAWVQQKNGEGYLGHGDWRLPNAKELQSIVDYSHAPEFDGMAAIDNDMFDCTAIANENNEADFPWYWTGTSHAAYNGMASAAAYVCFGRALGYMGSGWLDIHGAGCQRSDPKSGGLSGYAFNTNGYYNPVAPQGDGIRILNFVRLVRNA